MPIQTEERETNRRLKERMARSRNIGRKFTHDEERPWTSCVRLRCCNESLSTCEELALTDVGVLFHQDHDNILQGGTFRIADKLPHHVSNLVGPIGSPILADEYCLPNTGNRRVIVMSE